jgi:hypothetical protein
MLIPLMLWQAKAISEPYFYMSGYLEQRRDEYIDRMRDVSAAGSLIDWLLFSGRYRRPSNAKPSKGRGNPQSI